MKSNSKSTKYWRIKLEKIQLKKEQKNRVNSWPKLWDRDKQTQFGGWNKKKFKST
jgi:hypothetical protein